MIKKLSFLLVLYFLASKAAADCDACFYTADDPPDCYDYGKIRGDFVAWPKATQACLDSYKIKIAQKADVSQVCSSASSFVNAFRFGALANSDAALGLGVDEGFFFEPDEANIPKLKETITVNGRTIDCEAVPTDCWNGMKPYFEEGQPGALEKEQVCQTLENQNRNNAQLEQVTLRIRLCNEIADDTVSAECRGGDLEELMTAKRAEYPDLLCSGFGTGTGNATIPGCGPKDERASTTGGNVEDSPTDTADEASSAFFVSPVMARGLLPLFLALFF